MRTLLLASALIFVVFATSSLITACSKPAEPEKLEIETQPEESGEKVSAQDTEAESLAEDSDTDKSDEQAGTENGVLTGVSSQDVKRETRQAVETAKDYARRQKIIYQRKTKTQLRRYGEKIDNLKNRAIHKGDDAIDELERNLRVARRKLEELQSASEERWEEIEPEVKESLENLAQIIREKFPPSDEEPAE